MKNSVVLLLCVYCFNCGYIFNELGKILSVSRKYSAGNVCVVSVGPSVKYSLHRG